MLKKTVYKKYIFTDALRTVKQNKIKESGSQPEISFELH